MNTDIVGAGRQDFDVLAMLALMKDLRPDECGIIQSQIQNGNAAVLSALQNGDKAAMLAAAGIERAICDVRHDVVKEIGDTGRDLARSISDARYDLTRDITSSARDTIQSLSKGIDHLDTKLVCGFDVLSKELCDMRVKNLEISFEAQLREKDNLAAILIAARDNKDAIREEGRLTREQLRTDKLDDLREENLRLFTKANELKSDLRNLDRRQHERDDDRRYIREQFDDFKDCYGRPRYVRGYAVDDYDYHGGHGYHGCGRRGREHIELDQHFRFDLNQGRRRNHNGGDDNGNGNGHGNH